ncbi:MAG TPA: acetate--CoA ligase family protein [Anaerolineaceae bacterium]|nr:acetate--CoA ligase family protein [Anaerolineaceae bacterium]HPD62837.1 acetate--CoA ligase family protein [Anaerolineaceae bacterium]HRT92125.1 acetate--CoA ligase family protein [Anaerolineaceae bacterium]HUM63664.1 acetate--CoA ligase family protein [Anaerolineaceae bacterium]
MTSSLKPFFEPAGVAVIGASANPRKLSFGIMRNLVSSTYAGGIYPVNPGAEKILDKPGFSDISAVPDPLELAVIALPAPVIAETLEACGRRGVKAVIVISGGFKEVGEGGQALEARCLEIIHRYGMRMIGPNCVGLMNLHNGLNTTFIHGVPDAGGIGFMAQSGAVLGGVVDQVLGKKIGFSYFISMGNEADVTETDLMEYLGEDPRTRVIATYVEQIKDGRRFLETARRVSRVKPIVLLKGGRSSAGARAVSSHTGSLAGSYAAYQAAFRQAGVVEVESIGALFETALAFDFQPLPAGRRAVIVTNAGGPAALASDALSANGLVLDELGEKTRAVLRAALNPAAQVSNPVDILGGAEPPDYALCTSTLMKDEQVDIVLPLLVPQALVSPAGVAQAVADASAGREKTVLACVMGDISVDEARLVLHEHRIPMYAQPESAGAVLKAMLDYKDWLANPVVPPPALAGIERKAGREVLKAAGGKASLGEVETRPLLAAYGIPLVEGGFAANSAEAAAVAARIGYPVVMKIVSPQLLHKSDAGGIKLNLADEAALRQAYSAMMTEINAARPDALLEGVMVERMAPKGQEVIIGMRRDPGFGPLMMFGLGGIYVELFKDVSFRVAPLSAADARQMITETRAGRLLTGFRGQPRADLDAVVDVLLRLSRLALDHPEIQEAEVNPLLVFPEGQGALALDGRVILGN